jgi:hypothetical protein
MPLLKIIEKDSIQKALEIATVKMAQQFVNQNPFSPVLKFVYSTVNKDGIENTINIQKIYKWQYYQKTEQT